MSPEAETPGDATLPTNATEVTHEEVLNEAIGAAGGGIDATPSGKALVI